MRRKVPVTTPPAAKEGGNRCEPWCRCQCSQPACGCHEHAGDS